ncbi:hypothetical protein FGO68_gene6830 [Halteria grandinella]|uniref:Uncharacterized protein n=1 Tax=Halteria grandinella TaxID=5974 RepID=A0A8J8NC46_HALGN|nr:hypothetical protein FGO68_gene6830 [Halteria grandinella]
MSMFQNSFLKYGQRSLRQPVQASQIAIPEAIHNADSLMIASQDYRSNDMANDGVHYQYGKGSQPIRQ